MNSRSLLAIVVILGMIGLLIPTYSVMAGQQTVELKVPGCD